MPFTTRAEFAPRDAGLPGLARFPFNSPLQAFEKIPELQGFDFHGVTAEPVSALLALRGLRLQLLVRVEGVVWCQRWRTAQVDDVLAARVADGSWQRAQVGDLLAFTDSRSFFPAGEAECSDPRLAILDLHPTGPQWGEGDSPATGATHELEQKIAAGEPELRDWLVNAGMSQERRILRLPIGGLTWHYPGPDILQLEFVLPAGCFATVLVRELVDLVPVGQTDSPCVF